MAYAASRLESHQSRNPRRDLSPGEEQDFVRCRARCRRRVGYTARNNEKENVLKKGDGYGRIGRGGPPEISRLHRAHLLQRAIAIRPRRSDEIAESVSAAADRTPVMQLLIVHDDAEVGEQLAGMVTDYTEHDADLVASDAAAQQWTRGH